MELKTYFAQDAAGNIISSAIVNVFLQGTTTLATGLTRADGTPLENPFAADGAGRIQFRAPDGYYDVQVSAGPGIIQTLTIQCVDYSGAKADADRAESAADRADVSAEQAQNSLNSITGINTNFEQNSREQWRRSLAEAGLTLVSGSFEEGATVNSKTDAVWHISGGQCYTWDGAFPKAVPADSTPTSTGGIGLGAWVSVGDASLRSNLIDSSQGNGSSLITFNTGIESRLLSDKLGDIYTAKDAGIIGDGSDETSKLLNLINNRDGRVIDLQGLTISFTGISLTLTENLHVKNGVLNYIGTDTAFALKINTSAKVALESIKLDGASVAAKGLFMNATATTASLYVSGCSGFNFRETTTGLAAGLYATADASMYWDEIILDNIRIQDVTNAGTGTNVGRGVMVQNFKYCIATRLDVRRVAPYQDADGIYASSPNYPEAVFICGGSYFEDCQKRGVKSQIMNSRVFDIVERRTQAFAVGAGQSAVDLQAGGSLDGLTCFYADGAAPQSIVSGGLISGVTTFKGISLRNVDINCEDPTDVIHRLVSFFNNSSSTYDGYVAENIKCNCLIENLGYLYSNTGNSSPSAYIFKEVIFRNIQASGMASTSATAVVQISRGTSKYVKAIVRVQNCNLGDGTTEPVYYLDPAPGTTSLLEVLFRQIDNCRGFDTKEISNTDTSARIYVKTLDIAENSSGEITIPVTTEVGRTSLKILVMYNSSRDSSTAKLFTEGVFMQGNTTSYYIESTPGVKSNTNTGDISITASNSSITVSKTAGTTSAGGRLTVIITHLSSI